MSSKIDFQPTEDEESLDFQPISNDKQLDFQPAEEKKKPESFIDRLGKTMQMYMQQSPSSPEVAKKVALNVGTIAAVEGAMAPIAIAAEGSALLSALTSIATSAATGAAIPTVEELVESGQLPEGKKLLKEGGIWAAIESAVQALPYVGKYSKGIINNVKRSRPKHLADIGKALQEEIPKTVEQNINDIYKFQEQERKLEFQPLAEKTVDFKPVEKGKSVEESVSIGEDIQPKTEKPFKSFYTDVVDRFYPIKKYVEEAKISDLPISKDPYKLARLYQGWSGKAETFLKYKTFDPETITLKNKGLSEIIKPLKENLPEFSRYLVAKRAVELEKFGKETGIDIENAKDFVNKNKAKFEKQSREVDQYQKDLLDYAEKSELLSPELRKQWEGMYQNYVPMKRVVEEGNETYFGTTMQPKSPFYKLEGSKRPIIDPLESITENTYLTIRASEQNRVIKSLVDVSKRKDMDLLTGLSKELEEKPATINDFLDALKESSISDDGKVKYFEGGKVKTYQLPKEVADAVKSLKSQEFGMLEKLLSYPTRLVRAGAITFSPTTLLKLATIDQLEAFLYTDIGYVPYVDLAKGFYKSIKKPELYWKWKASGGDQSLARELSRSLKQKKLKDISGQSTFKDVISSPDDILRKFEEFSRPLEEATRISVFEKALRRTGMSGDDLREAALMAREATLDFGRKGAKTRLMNQAIPFFNAAIQGADKFFRAVKENPKLLWKAFATVTLPSLGLYWLNKDRKEYQELPDWEKDNYWHIYVPYLNKNLHFRIPKPFELGAVFATAPERLAEFAKHKDPDSLKEIGKTLWETFTPNFIPAAATPVIETLANKRMFSGSPIVPSRLERLPQEEQIGPYTTTTAKNIGKILSKIPYIGDTKAASPIMIDHWINSMTAGMGSALVRFTEGLLSKTGITPERIDPEKELSDYPIFKTIFGKEGYSTQAKSIQQFYAKTEEMQKYKNAFNLAKKERRYDDMARLSGKFNEQKLKKSQVIRKAFSKNFSAIRNIQLDNEHYTASEKKILIDQLIKDMVGVARSFLDKD